MGLLQSLAAYKIIKALATPFPKWPAYKLGLIDDKGRTLREPKTKEEKDSLSLFDRVIKNVKKLIMRAPMGSFAVGSLIVALKILKEDAGHDVTDIVLEYLDDNGIVLQLNEDDNSKEPFCQGKYIDNLSEKMFIVKEELFPCDIIMGCPVYEVTDVVGKDVLFVTRDNVRMV